MVTFLSLREQARTRSDMTYSNFVSEDELKLFVNGSIKELYDLLVGSYADFYTADAYQFTIEDSSNTLSLPSDFYKLRGLDRSLDNSGADTSWYTVNNFNFQQRNAYNQLSVALNGRVYPYVKYRVMGSADLSGNGYLQLIPQQSAAGLYRMWYIQRCPDLVDDEDEFNGISGWEEYVVVDVAIKMLQKEESDASALVAQKANLKKRIEQMSSERDAGIAETIVDVRSSDWSDWGY